MKKLLLLLTVFVLGGLNLNAQNTNLPNKLVGTIQTDGTVLWNVSLSELNVYLTAVLNNDHGINGTITQSNIIYSTGLGYWIIVGQGIESNDTSKVRNLRVQLGLGSNGELTVQAGGDTESCTGAPCEKCKFLDEGGCDCEADSFGTCNHTVTKTTGGGNQ